MLRECARYEALAKIMLNSEDFFNFFRYVEVSTFDIASDAFSTFKVLTFFPTLYDSVFRFALKFLQHLQYSDFLMTEKMLGFSGLPLCICYLTH